MEGEAEIKQQFPKLGLDLEDKAALEGRGIEAGSLVSSPNNELESEA